ncbi:glycosyltransferase 87 family protein [Lentzea flava]|uniref:Polyprenol-phosphate-mannose-dependent alpha-(1-2)-phosphatidylinositol pentamannoside mannosyltransferase n=1 Tax=Lentzea flava TaxID=103732 RepID=A0ABQ2UEP7_9PSEU|nr:glycosyltransferase 87 family protein [Lentzea flava]MCP2201025.1 alpha-1,2-mannosyltransferase [Lentzea flava]GGU27716.1 polyprenol-phosphate-mannose-dependent alpha-(1-2)-phosphatidylinositol pentamannoside mannosyltransferase [Lentzea flava]
MRQLEQRLLPVAPWLLVISAVVRTWVIVTGFGNESIDLYVYWSLAPHVLDGDLYQVTSPHSPPDFPLPFTYPPFGALVFLPMTWMFWGLAQWSFRLLSVLCLYWIVRVTLRLVAGEGWTTDARLWRQRAILWTAVLLWMMPVFHTFEFGQINLVLAAVVLAAMVARDQRVAGAGIGLTAGVKLVPAISGLYFLATRRWAAALWSIVAFAASVGLGFLVDFNQARQYWFVLFGDPDRVGPIATAHNQSLRGALSRTFGYDVGMSWPWLIAAVIAVIVTGFALRAAVRAGDALIGVVTVQFLGLLLSPISWDHHWVWVAPLLIWLVHHRIAPWARTTLLVLWVPVMFWDVIAFQLHRQPTIWTISRPGWLSAVGWVYPAFALVTLVVIAVALTGALRIRSTDLKNTVRPIAVR